MANAVILSDCATIKTLRFQERLSEHSEWPVRTFRWASEGSELNLKMKIRLFTHPQVVSNSYDLVSSVEQKMRTLAECSGSSFPYHETE